MNQFHIHTLVSHEVVKNSCLSSALAGMASPLMRTYSAGPISGPISGRVLLCLCVRLGDLAAWRLGTGLRGGAPFRIEDKPSRQ